MGRSPTEILTQWSDFDRTMLLAYLDSFPEYDLTFSSALIASSNLWAQGVRCKVTDFLPKKALSAEETSAVITQLFGGGGGG